MVERPKDPGVPLRPPGTPDPAPAGMEELDEVVRPRVSARKRAAQVGVVLAVVVVVVGLLLHGIGPALQGTASLLPSPTPTPSTVVIASNVTFGTLTVNGQVLHGAPPLVTHLFHVGTNVVTLAAPPFARHTCHFLFPSDQPSAETGCEGGGSVSGTVDMRGVSVVPVQILDIELSATDLPADLAARADGAARQAVAAAQPQTVVPTGQYYATGQDAQGHITAQRASAPLQAAVRVRPAGGCGPSPFCPTPLDPSLDLPPGQHVWSVGFALTANWDFTPPVGPVVGSPPLLLMLPLQLFLAYDGAGGWRVVSLPAAVAVPGPGTGSLADQLTFALCQAGASFLGTLVQGPNGYGYSTPYERGVEGCIIQLLAGSSTSTIQGTSLGTFLWRFGVLLAVDAGAHTLAPWLPIAPQAEVAAVEG